MTAVDEFGPVIDDIYDFSELQGFEIDGITQEGGRDNWRSTFNMGIRLNYQMKFFTLRG